MLEYLGTFPYQGADDFKRIYHLWAVVDDEGEVCAIHYGISHNHQTASGEIHRSDCDSALRKHAFALAEERYARNEEDDDFAVIDDHDCAEGHHAWH